MEVQKVLVGQHAHSLASPLSCAPREQARTQLNIDGEFMPREGSDYVLCICFLICQLRTGTVFLQVVLLMFEI